MMRIGIDINGVLRDTLLKFEQLYQKNLIDNQENKDKTYELSFSGESNTLSGITENVNSQDFKYEIISDVNTDNLLNHFKFPNEEDLFSFMYEEYTMELFGHAPSTEMTTFNILNDLYYELRNNYELLIISEEIGKSKPASLFFLAKFGCLIEKVVFYSELTKNKLWEEVDVFITANPKIIKTKPKDKIIVKYNTNYNNNIISDFEISTLSDFSLLLKKIDKDYV